MNLRPCPASVASSILHVTVIHLLLQTLGYKQSPLVQWANKPMNGAETANTPRVNAAAPARFNGERSRKDLPTQPITIVRRPRLVGASRPIAIGGSRPTRHSLVALRFRVSGNSHAVRRTGLAADKQLRRQKRHSAGHRLEQYVRYVAHIPISWTIDGAHWPQLRPQD
jgi:hypothetical protein